MNKAWREFLKDAFEPDDYADRPVEGACNQFGHYALGLVVAQVMFYAAYEVTGLVWGKWLLLTLALLPGVIVEGSQGWKGADTVWDFWFYTLGVLSIYLSLTEITPGGGLYPTPLTFFAVFAAGAVSLIVYLNPRIKRRYGAK
jgi:hypothetical protein